MGFISAFGTGYAAPTAGWAHSRHRAALLALAALPLIGASPSASVDVDLSGLRSTRGLIQACLTTDPDHFPDCQSDPASRRVTLPAVRAARFTFADLPSGTYALALIHDENSNGRLDTFMGLPREGFGFSRNPPIRFGPPRFAAADFAVGNRPVGEAVAVRYLL